MSAPVNTSSRSVYSSRIERVRQALPTKSGGIDALTITSLPNIGYLSGFTGSAAILVISQTDAVLITDGRYAVQAREQCPDYAIHISAGSGGYGEALGQALGSLANVQTLGFDDADLTIQRLEAFRKGAPDSIRWIASGGMIENLRFVKDAGEIAQMRDAIQLAQDAFDAVRASLKPGTKERDFAIDLEFTMRRMGADAPSFDTIVASGPNGALPHYHPGERQFEAGDLVTIDWGARLNGYCSDITRTVAIPGKAVDAKLREIYNLVQRAKIDAISACVVGANGKAVDSVARDVIGAAGYGEYFSHSLGHSLGRETHDGATLSQRGESVILQQGVVTTVEPGIYIEGLGGVRIEEDVLVTENGPVILTAPDDEMI